MERKTKVITEPNSYEILVLREFDASCELVFKAHVEPALFARWYGCDEMTTRVEHFDVKTGGSYRLFQRIGSSPEGSCRGVYHEVVPHSRIVQTSEFAGHPGHVLLQTTTFESLSPGRSRITNKMIFQSVEDRDAMVEFGVDRGTDEAFNKLQKILNDL
jgi:uncharacterized protein YndB with AHSA1/START domain